MKMIPNALYKILRRLPILFTDFFQRHITQRTVRREILRCKRRGVKLVERLEAAQGWAAMTAAVRKRDVFVGGAAFFAYFLSPPKESRFYKLKLNRSSNAWNGAPPQLRQI